MGLLEKMKGTWGLSVLSNKNAGGTRDLEEGQITMQIFASVVLKRMTSILSTSKAAGYKCQALWGLRSVWGGL